MSLIDLASLVLAPTATKEGKVYSAIPDTGEGDMTFTRGSAATRVNSEGLIEKERGNLLLQSNTFDTTWATSVDITATSGQAGYDGSNDAWLLKRSSNASRFIYQNLSAGSSVYTLSFYGKPESEDWAYLYSFNGSTAITAYFDLQNGVVGTTSGSVISTNIEAAGNGYYRCSLTYNTSVSQVRIYPAVDNGSVTGGVTDAGIYIQDAMLNQGLVAQSYIPTTTSAVYEGITDDVPRVDYSGGGCPSLLLEPSRTQLLTHSEYFDDWLSNRLDRTANSIISPEGVQNAYKMAQQSGFTTAPNINVGGIAAGTYTISIFAKKGSWNYLAISFQGVSYFNLETGSKGTINSNHTATIEDYGNGWYRCAITRTTTTTQTPAFYFAESDNTLTTPDTQGYMYTYGAMYEAGSYVSSYINSYGTSTTRVADSCSKTGISELIGQSEGTLFAEFIMPPTGTLFTHYRISGSGGLYNDSQNITLTTTNQIRGWSFSGTSEQAQINSGVYAEGTKVKVAYAYKTNDFILYVNGTQIGTDTSGSVPSMSELLVGSYYPNTSLNVVNKTKQTILFPTRLTNDQLAELTK